ncbi:MAG TPA: toll/interleukin-1 receptor domain-containing protein [Ktedonobacterales bacterium]|jgi:hypothetical protein
MAKPKIFVSHSTLDAEFATKLVNDLKAAGADAWIDSTDMGPGNFQQRIDEALTGCEWFLLVLTPNALASKWVRLEVDAAIRFRSYGKIKGLIFIKAADIDHTTLPAFWGTINIFDGISDYAPTLRKIQEAVGVSPIGTPPGIGSHQREAKSKDLVGAAKEIPSAKRPSTPSTSPSGNIIINYGHNIGHDRRRQTSAEQLVGGLVYYLTTRYGEDQVLVEPVIEPGDDIEEVVETAVSTAKVMLSIIDPGWPHPTDDTDPPPWFVGRHNVAMMEHLFAQRHRIRVIPVLIYNATMPMEYDMPSELRACFATDWVM